MPGRQVAMRAARESREEQGVLRLPECLARCGFFEEQRFGSELGCSQQRDRHVRH